MLKPPSERERERVARVVRGVFESQKKLKISFSICDISQGGRWTEVTVYQGCGK